MVRKTNEKTGRSACAEFPMGRRGRRAPKAIRRRHLGYGPANVGVFCLGMSLQNVLHPNDEQMAKIERFMK